MVKYLFILLTLFFLLHTSCQRDTLNPNIKNIPLEIKINRFDKELFEMNTDTLSEGITFFMDKYSDFFDIFSYHVINIGVPGDDYFPEYLLMFVTDELNKEVYNETISLFNDLSELENTFTNAFKRYKYYFPDKDVPVIITYISRFNHPCFTVENYIGIGLDKYLGSDSPYYKSLSLPYYQRRNMFAAKISSDAIYSFGTIEVPYDETFDNLLNRIIQQGRIMYFVDALLPDQADSLKMGFSADQMKWCKNNEKRMWEYIIENKLIFSTDQMIIQKLTGPAPFTYYFSSESPGRTGVWIGWQIVKKFANNNKNLKLRDILYETDYQKILRESRYNP